MLINLTDVLTSEGKVKEIQAEIEFTQISCRMGDFPVTEKSPVLLTLKNLGINKALVEGRAQMTLAMNCDRCLKSVPQKITLHFARQVTAPEESMNEEEEDEQNFMDGYRLNIDSLIRSECFMNLPAKVLCKPDCKGICIKCGKDLNTGECGCDTFVPDPRMARIKDIFEAKREV